MRQATDAAVMEAMGRTAQSWSGAFVSVLLVYLTLAVDQCSVLKVLDFFNRQPYLVVFAAPSLDLDVLGDRTGKHLSGRQTRQLAGLSTRLLWSLRSDSNSGFHPKGSWLYCMSVMFHKFRAGLAAP